ncbi:uncharacterized protein LOC126549940 isoform X2 [Aphis gossypii]|uniref:uncharacterized protein LOC126549940 isoform X2 n=1 Tax=Aphis gossypii TaxID=80765 RepID=UPI002159515E|nr:uncharacterized protein LOC126549940 isoform X2 [Aphis gossypii]
MALRDHDYVIPANHEEVGLPAHLLDHDYFRPVVYENNPNEELTDEEVEVLENERVPADEEVLEEEDPEDNPLNQDLSTTSAKPELTGYIWYVKGKKVGYMIIVLVQHR